MCHLLRQAVMGAGTANPVTTANQTTTLNLVTTANQTTTPNLVTTANQTTTPKAATVATANQTTTPKAAMSLIVSVIGVLLIGLILLAPPAVEPVAPVPGYGEPHTQ